jgi:hypothetical protein
VAYGSAIHGQFNPAGYHHWYSLWNLHNYIIIFLMPTPNQNESEQEFIDRCIPYVLNEGTARNIAQAYAMCDYIYQNKQNGISINQNNQAEPKEPENN